MLHEGAINTLAQNDSVSTWSLHWQNHAISKALIVKRGPWLLVVLPLSIGTAPTLVKNLLLLLLLLLDHSIVEPVVGGLHSALALEATLAVLVEYVHGLQRLSAQKVLG